MRLDSFGKVGKLATSCRLVGSGYGNWFKPAVSMKRAHRELLSHLDNVFSTLLAGCFLYPDSDTLKRHRIVLDGIHLYELNPEGSA